MPVAPRPMPPFRAEVIGSLLRSRRLKDAGRAVQEGRLPAAEYDATLEQEIARVIARQEDIGLRVVSDGELARSSWFGFFFERLEGFRLEPSHFKFRDADGATFEWPTCVACAQISRRGPITLGEFERANALVRRALVKATMPAPSAFHFFRLGRSVDAQAYADVSGFFDDLVAVYRAELAELARAGCRYVQFDEVPIAMLCDPEVSRQAQALGCDPATLIETYISLLQRIAADPPAPMRLGLHLCRGNFRGRWMAAGGYEPVAEKLFNEAPVDTFLLEYDSERAGDFRPLRFLPRHKTVVLGLVSSKSAPLEDQDTLLRRIDEAAHVVAVEQLGLSSQCGFASVAGGNALAEEEQWEKLELVVDTAQRVWGCP
jgi:5-methyltetrahydropteroyltriglutamate--homocysteine methyltransferase